MHTSNEPGAAFRVLAVDDEPATLLLLRRVLEHARYEVRTASTVEDGFTSAIEWLPDVIVLDVHVGRHDGRELLRRVREQLVGHAPAVLLCSGDDAALCDCAPRLPKPFRMHQLIAAVDALARAAR